jgi:hypothetical protein
MSRWRVEERRESLETDRQKQYEHYLAMADQVTGQMLRQALDQAGLGGRVVVTRLHDEVSLIVEKTK